MIITLLSFFLQPVNGAYSSYLQLILRNSGYSQSMVGVIIAVGLISSIILPFFAAGIVEKTGNDKVVMFVSVILGIIGIVPAILGAPVWLTMIMFFVCMGALWTTLSLADGYINKCINNDNARYGVIRGMGTLGYVIFMTLFSVTGFPDETNNIQILYNIILCSAIFSAVLLISPNSSKYSVTVKSSEKKKYFDAKWFDKSFFLFIITVAFSRVSMSAFDKLLPSYMTENLGLGKWFTAFTALGAFAEFFMLIFGGRFVAKHHIKPLYLLMLSATGIIVRLAMYLSSSSVVVFAIAQTLHAFCFGACQLAANNYITHHVSPAHVSAGFAIYWTAGVNLPSLIGTLFGGFVIDNLGYSWLFAIDMVFPAICLALCAVFKKQLLKEISYT